MMSLSMSRSTTSLNFVNVFLRVLTRIRITLLFHKEHKTPSTGHSRRTRLWSLWTRSSLCYSSRRRRVLDSSCNILFSQKSKFSTHCWTAWNFRSNTKRKRHHHKKVVFFTLCVSLTPQHTAERTFLSPTRNLWTFTNTAKPLRWIREWASMMLASSIARKCTTSSR